MSLLAAAPPTDPVADLDACLDRVAALDLDRLDDRHQEVLLRALGRSESRIAAVKLRLLAVAERSKTAATVGMASTGQWAASSLHADPAVTQRQVLLSQQLEGRSATQAALAAGDVTAEHASVIVLADQQLPTGVTTTQREAVESTLLAKARMMAPGALRQAARRALAAIEADQHAVDAHEDSLVRNEEAAARARTRLTLHDNDDGTVTGHFTVPAVHGHLLRKILQTISAPRRGRLGSPRAQVGATGLTSWDRARGEAFCEVIEHLPTDHLHPKTAATLIVTITEATLRGALAAAHLDTNATISAGEARRMACGASLIPAVLGGASLPLDLGRASRLFSEPQRIALGLRHRTCASDGCERPFAWCELHHRTAWSRGGRTDLAEAIPLCHFHHQRMHDPDYEHRQHPGGIAFYRRT